MKELIAELNALKINENEGLPYDFPEALLDKYPDLRRDPVAEGLDPDEHRWYTLETNVYQIGEEFMGVRVVGTIKSESMDRDSIYNTLKFFPMKKVMVESFETIKEPSITEA